MSENTLPALIVKDTAPVLVTTGALPQADRFDSDFLNEFLSGRNERTTKAYKANLQDFAAFLQIAEPVEALKRLFNSFPGDANRLVLNYRADLMNRGLQPATINQRLAALRSAVKRARIIGVISWTLEVPGLKHSAYRDTRGCGAEGFRKLLESAARQSPKKAARDIAILRLLFDLALRRGEVTGLDLEDIDVEGKVLAVKGKGRNNEKELLTLPAKTAEALRNWLEVRGSESGVLFFNFDHAAKGERLTGRSVDRLVKYLGKRIGLKDIRPHGLRHATITEALDLTGGDVRKVQRFSRHRDIRILSLYDDNREDFGGQVASLVSELA